MHSRGITAASTRPPAGLARWGVAASIFAAGSLIAIAVFATTRSRERAARRLALEKRASQITLSAQSSFDVPLEVLRSVPALFDASVQVTRQEFRAFVTGALERYPWLYAVEWIPRVPGDERARYESQAIADGLTGYQFKQDSPAGPPVPADERPEYFPLYYMEPANLVALGIEETALPARKVALERARDLGITVVSERLRLVQDEPSVVSVIAFHPVYAPGERPATVEARRRSLRGLGAVVFRVRPVVERALRDVDPEQLDVALLDIDADPPALLYASRPGAGAASGDHIITIGGRRWAVRVADRAGGRRAAGDGLLELGLGLLASALAAGLAYAFQAARRLRRQVNAARRLGQYTLVESLGRGGMGEVFRAHHALLRRPTAIKLLHDDETMALARFEAEVQLTSSLTHPNTVVVYDYGRSADGVFYYAMELIDGITLQALVDHAGPQPPARVVHILVQACGALAEAHGVGLVHRDIKPANIMLCRRGTIDDFVKVFDFGLAKDLTTDLLVSQPSEVMGTPLYIAPEVTLNQPIDARTDLYALGAVAYFLLTGTPVFTGNSAVEVCVHHMSTPPEPPSERLGSPLPAGLEELVLRCLAKKPEERPASAEELASSLAALGIEAWTASQAKSWWAGTGRRVEQEARAEHRRKEGLTHESLVEIDPARGRPA